MPEVGSPMELLFLVLWRMRQQVEFHKSRVVVQALLAQQGVESKHVEAAYDDLRSAYFPFEKAKRDEEIVDLKKVMHRELARGAIAVKPLADLTKDNMRNKLAQGAAAIKERADLLKAGRLRNIDQGDPFQAARTKERGVHASLTGTGLARGLAQHSFTNPTRIA